MPKQTTSGVVREILTADLGLTADEVIDLARSQGVKAPDASIRGLVYNIRADLKKAGAIAVPSAARETVPPKAVDAPVAAPSLASVIDLSAVLANVTLVNTVAGQCGGVENARRAAEAVRACGSVEAFLQHLDLVAGIRSPETTA